ncbi:MAG: DEAD/DEAH box helicase [Candidatus Krumholzibacteria bacterium]|jgi:ATP-dependent RNA helicase RhlE|nr:DEAD/DEAH box helicase [Candidatus Krumholzibacteria bacterium]
MLSTVVSSAIDRAPQPSFLSLGLLPALTDAVLAAGYRQPTRIQAAAIPAALAGRDLIATAQTGTGKTAAFALPILQRLAGRAPARACCPQALVLTPTRELAQQIAASLAVYRGGLPIRTAAVVGGVQQEPQVKALRHGVEILVATPGRLLDLIDQGYVAFDQLEVFVLDEADRMLDMGFVHAVRHVAGLLPRRRQTLFFSATMPAIVTRLAADLLRDPHTITVSPPASVSGQIDQRVLFVAKTDKRALLSDLLASPAAKRVLVFTRTKRGADRLAKQLRGEGLRADAIHADRTQSARERVLADFSGDRLQVLVATDIVARGIDVAGISHVVNFELPDEPENYVHRIGRTARAEAHGIGLALCGIEELSLLHGIERLTRQPLTVVTDHRYHAANVAACFMSQRRAVQMSAQRGAYRSYRGHRGRRATMR